MTRIIGTLLCLLLSSAAHASAARVLDGATITNGAATLTLPSTTTTLDGTSNTATLTNKTIDGSANTLSKLPVSTQIITDSGAGNGSTTAFTMSFAAPSASAVQVFLDGTLQESTTDYTISGTTLTFTTAPATGQTIRAVYSRY